MLFTKENKEDVYQDTIAEFWPKKDKFPNNDPILPILIGFSDNIIRRLVRQKQKDWMLYVKIKFNNLFRVNSYYMTENEEKEVIYQLKDIISEMSPSDAQILSEYYISQKTFKEIIDEFGLIDTVLESKPELISLLKPTLLNMKVKALLDVKILPLLSRLFVLPYTKRSKGWIIGSLNLHR